MRSSDKVTAVVFGLLIYGIHISLYVLPGIHQMSEAPEGARFSLHELSGDHQLYLIQTQDAYRNGPSLFQRDPYVLEAAGQTFPRGNVVHSLVALLLHIWDDINFLLFASALIGVFLAVLLAWKSLAVLHGQEAIGAHRLALWLSLLFMLVTAYNTFFYLREGFSVLLGNDFTPNLTANYNFRFPHIQFTLFMLLAWFWRLQVYLREGTTANAVLLGLSLAFLQYGYFYYWTAAIAMTGLAMLPGIRRGRAFWWEAATVMGVYVVLAAPYWQELISFNATPFADEYKLRIGGHFELESPRGGIPALTSFLLLAFDAVDHWWGGRQAGRRAEWRAVLGASRLQLLLTATVVLCLNLQLVTGITVQSYHWLYTFWHPLLALALFGYILRGQRLVSSIWRRTGARLYGLLLWSLNGVILASMAHVVLYWAPGKAPDMVLEREELEVIDYFGEKTPEDAVVMSNDYAYMHTVNMLAGRRSFLPYSFLSVVGDRELLQRAWQGYSALGYSRAELMTGFRHGTSTRPDSLEVNLERYGRPSLLGLYTYTYKSHSFGSYTYPDSFDVILPGVFDDPAPPRFQLDYVLVDKWRYAEAWERIAEAPVFENARYRIVPVHP